MNWQDYIEQKPDVLCGKPVFKGTRLAVEMILERLGHGWDPAELLNSFPNLRPEHLRAAQLYGAAVIRMDETIFKAG